MADPDPRNDTSADYEQFETELLAQDCDIAGVDTADIDDATARNLVSGLTDMDAVTPVPEDRVFVHEPSLQMSMWNCSLVRPFPGQK